MARDYVDGVSFRLGVSKTRLRQIKVTRIFNLKKIYPLRNRVRRVLLTVTRFFRLDGLYVNDNFIQMPLSRRRIFHFCPMMRPRTVYPRRVIRVVRLFTIQRTGAFLYMRIFQLRLRRLGSLGKTLRVLILQNTLVQTLPTNRGYLRRRVTRLSTQRYKVRGRFYFLLS